MERELGTHVVQEDGSVVFPTIPTDVQRKQAYEDAAKGAPAQPVDQVASPDEPVDPAEKIDVPDDIDDTQEAEGGATDAAPAARESAARGYQRERGTEL